MAKLNKIIRANPLSSFQQVAPDGGAAFRVFAEAMATANERIQPAAIQSMEEKGAEAGREAAAGNQVSIPGAGDPDTLSLIREFEGYRDTPYWDVNAHRVGYGSDTITDADGNVRKVTEGDRITREDAERDLERRVNTEFVPIARNAIGAERFDAMTPGQKAAVTSIAYNYGEIPDRIVGALRTGSAEDAAAAIRSLGGDNDGINKDRRNREADIFLQSGNTVLSTRNQPGAVIRTKEGRLEPRRYSPFAGPILQAYNAAARVAEHSELINQSQIGLFELSNQYELDPDGFAQAAKSYIEQIIDGASPDVRQDLADTLGSEVRRRAMGIMDAKQRDIRARADNSSRALVTRWQGEYAEALATGDPEEIEAAKQRLSNVLQARENLPGVAWTPEQSTNVLLKAEQDAEKILANRAKEQSSQVKADLELIIDAAKAGRQAESEEILTDPNAVALHPELAREAAAFVALRDSTPDFLKLTPEQQAAEIARITAGAVSEEWELDVAEAAVTMAKENKKAWDKDPVKRAGEVFDTPPPALPELTPEDPQKFVEALSERREYMNLIVDAGYTDTRAYLTEEEAEQISVFMGKGTDPALRAAMSAAIVAGFGPDAVRVFDEIGGDTVTMFAGKMQAIGGRPDVAAAMLQGQQMLAENLVQLPKNSDRIEAFNAQIATAFDGIPGAPQAQSELMEAAKAIYASKAQGIEPNSEAAKDLMAQSIQTALGQSKNKKGQTTGGVQEVMGHPTLLPIGVPGTDVERAIRLAMGGNPEPTGNVLSKASRALTDIGMSILGGEQPDRTSVWEAIGVTGGPMFNGKPIPQAYINNDLIRVVSVGGNMVRLEMTNGTARFDVEDGDGNVLMFDITKLLEAME